jgi:hypothetical protein
VVAPSQGAKLVAKLTDRELAELLVFIGEKRSCGGW